MTCMHDRDEQCFEDCPNCVRSDDKVCCAGCQQMITDDSAIDIKGDKYCFDCIDGVLIDEFKNMSCAEKMIALGY